MLIGVPKEVKTDELRCGLTPESVHELVAHGHQVIIETGAGLGIAADDSVYQAAGAEIVDSAETVFARAEMIVKVKEPQPQEIKLIRENQLLFTYLHLSPDPQQTQGLLESGCVAVAYETVTASDGRLPLLAPMSEVAGRLSVQVGAYHLQSRSGGLGALLGGVPGVPSENVVVLGGGVAGTHAAKMAVGLGANVTIIDRSLERLRQLDDIFSGRVRTQYANTKNIEESVTQAALVIGSVLIPGANAPKLITRDLVKKMRKGSVIVDIAIDQGGCCETSRATTHSDPIFIEDGVVHYCVANMPGAVPRTSTYALNHATLPFALALANKGVKQALLDNPHLKNGLNVARGKLCYQAVAEAQGRAYTASDSVLATL